MPRRLLFCTGILFGVLPLIASAQVVLSELMWMGSDLSTADEWVEIYSGSDTLLEGWYLTVVNTNKEEKIIFTFPGGVSIGSGQYIIVSNYDAEHSRLAEEPEYVDTAMSLPNTKLLLRLYNASGTLIDTVDDGVGEPFAGENASGTGARRSMERISLVGSGSDKANWASASVSVGFDSGFTLFGTPGSARESGSASLQDSEDVAEIRESPLTGVQGGTGSVQAGTGSVMTSSGSIETGSSLRPPSADSGWQAGSTSSESESGSTSDSGSVSSGSASGSVSLGSGSSESGSGVDPLEFLSNPTPNPSPVRITEVLANPKGKDDDEWIEIGNLGSGSVNIAGWILDEGNSPESFTVPAYRTLSGAYPPKIESGFILAPGEYVSFRKSVTHLPLGNNGEALSLMSGSLVIDAWAYPETAEEVSYSRVGSGFLAFCKPSEGLPNENAPLDPGIIIQSGQTSGVGKVSINLTAEVLTGSLASAECSWSYSDGFTSESCNPPSHTFKEAGTHTVQLSVQTFCGDTVHRELSVDVLAIVSNARRQNASATLMQAPGDTLEQSGVPVAGESCTPAYSSDVIINEFFPNPYGEEKEEEWVELKNAGNETVSLCGWLLDDEDGGSKPYRFEGEEIFPGGLLLLPRSQTNIALNNDADTVRLFSGAENLVSHVSYAKSPEGESMGLRSDGVYVWTPYATPEAENRFRTAERRFPGDRLIVSAVLPNPVGKDDPTSSVGDGLHRAKGEWVEIANVSDEPFAIHGWAIDNKDGGSKPFLLNGITLQPNAVRRFTIQETGITFTNTADTARLLDPDGYVVSVLQWTEAVEGRIYRPAVVAGERVPAHVVHVVDGDTVDIILTDITHLDRVPGSLKRKWLGVQHQDYPHIRVRMIGIDTPETVHPSKPVQAYGKEASAFTFALLEGKNVQLEFDSIGDLWDKYERLLAYIFVEDGTFAQADLLRHGLAYAYLRFPFSRSAEFVAYENEAKQAKLGLWSDETVRQVVERTKQEDEEEAILEEIGLELHIDPSSGLVASGTVVTFSPSPDADVYVSVHSGAYHLQSGAYLVTEDVWLRAYGERAMGTGSIRSPVIDVWYVLPQAEYKQEVMISEVYPSPITSGSLLETGEWVELTNLTDHPVSLAGWSIDDVQDGGSKPRILSAHVVVPGSGRLILSGNELGIGLNNAGDDVWLISPDGKVKKGITYPSVKKGMAYAFAGMSGHLLRNPGQGEEEWCLTDTPTPLEQNICSISVTPKVKKRLSTDKKETQFRSGLQPGLYTGSYPGPHPGTGAASSAKRFLWERYRNVIVSTGTGETVGVPEVWRRLRRLQAVEPHPSVGMGEEAKFHLGFLARAKSYLRSHLHPNPQPYLHVQPNLQSHPHPHPYPQPHPHPHPQPNPHPQPHPVPSQPHPRRGAASENGDILVALLMIVPALRLLTWS